MDDKEAEEAQMLMSEDGYGKLTPRQLKTQQRLNDSLREENKPLKKRRTLDIGFLKLRGDNNRVSGSKKAAAIPIFQQNKNYFITRLENTNGWAFDTSR